MNLFLLWLLQHYIIAIFTCGLKDNLDHGVGNPARCRQRTEDEALALAAELLLVVASRRGFQPESSDEEPE